MKILIGLTMAMGFIWGISPGIQAAPWCDKLQISQDTSAVASSQKSIPLKTTDSRGNTIISSSDGQNESTITVLSKGGKEITIIETKGKDRNLHESNVYIKKGDRIFAFKNSGKWLSLSSTGDKSMQLKQYSSNNDPANHSAGKNEIQQDLSPKLGNSDSYEQIELNSNGIDTTKIRVGKKSFVYIEKGDDKVLQMSRKQSLFFYPMLNSFYMGFNGFAKSNYDRYAVKDFMDVKFATSLEVGFYFIQGGIRLINHTLGLVSGVGMSFNDYRFKNDYTIYKDQTTGLIVPKFLDPALYPDLDKTKLSVSYLNVPILLQLNMPSASKTFYLLGGIEGGLNMGGHTKIKYGSGTKDKDHGDLDINPFKATALVRAGTSDFQVYAKYNLTKLFENGKGPELTPLSFGVCLVFQ